jgi:hypothetical protein
MKQIGLIASVLTMLTAPVVAQEIDLAGKISVELNAVQTTENNCTLTFFVINGLDKQIDKAVYETVLFDKSGQVNRLTLFDFGTLPVARPRVRQFALPQVECEQLGRVLFNGANTCEGEGLQDGICGTNILPSSRTSIEVLG